MTYLDEEGFQLNLRDSPSPDFRECFLALQLINERLGWDWQLTSFIRGDNRAHAEGRALDFAARSGPLFEARQAGICPNYHVSRLIAEASTNKRTLREIVSRCPRLHLILIEPDHLHLETSKYLRPRRLDVVQYASRANILCPSIVERTERTLIAMELRDGR